MEKNYEDLIEKYENNALVQRFEEEREESDDFDIVSKFNDILHSVPPIEPENVEEVREFAEFLRDTVFTCPAHYEKMLDKWGGEPPFMKSAGVTVNKPEEEADECCCSSCYRSFFDDDDDDDDNEVWEEDDEEITAIDLAYDMLDIIHDVSGKNDSYLLDFFAENARTSIVCSENIKDRMEDTVVEFLKTYFLEGGILLFKNFRLNRNGKLTGTLMGFIAEEGSAGYGAISKTMLKNIVKNTEYNLEKGIVVRQYDRKDFEPDDSGEE